MENARFHNHSSMEGSIIFSPNTKHAMTELGKKCELVYDYMPAPELLRSNGSCGQVLGIPSRPRMPLLGFHFHIFTSMCPLLMLHAVAAAGGGLLCFQAQLL